MEPQRVQHVNGTSPVLDVMGNAKYLVWYLLSSDPCVISVASLTD